VLLALTAGCSGAQPPAEQTSPRTLRVLVRDVNLRPVGADCAGTGGYTHFHHRAPFRILDPAGEALVTGTLPAGTAVAAFTEDLGVQRVPTYCEFAVGLRVPTREGYRLTVADRPPYPLTPDDSEGPALVAVVP
jgi:hypothetical protein